MTRRFNTAGPCNPADHYMLPALRRLPDARRLVDEKGYFVLAAPRQVGKTTTIRALAEDLTTNGTYAAFALSMEVGAPFSEDPGTAETAILENWRGAARSRRGPEDLQPPPWPDAPAGSRIYSSLAAWARAIPRPLVVFLDEIDSLSGETLISVLRQLRSGYPDRPADFPWSLALVGLRDVRDYRASPFNIKIETLTLRDFTRDEVAEFYEQHTAETGQRFAPEAIDRAFALTRGQPWLVNALARQLVERLVPDRARAIGAPDVDAAKEVLIEREDTHLDSLAERLREPRVRSVIEPILAGMALGDVPVDDVRYVRDLGLVRLQPDGGIEVVNPIYREVIPRSLATTPRASLPVIPASWLGEGGRLDTDRLLDAFLAFWRQHGQPLMGSAPYHEIAPHLVLMAFLHWVANAGGTLEREYAIGSGRMDLCLRYGPDVLAIEIKVWRDGEPDPIEEGLSQLDGYLAGLGLERGWLVIFDRRSRLPRLAERTSASRARSPASREVAVIRA